MCDETELEMKAMEIFTTAVLPPSSTGRKRDLGGAILLAAIDDYRSMDEETHKDAQQFLYPQSEEWRDHYDWVVGLAEGVNGAWLRDALDRFRPQWDAERFGHLLAIRGHRAGVELEEGCA